MRTRLHNIVELHLIKSLTDKIQTMGKIKITYSKSKIGSNQRQKKTIEALGLKKLNNSVEVEGTPQIMGMVEKVSHLVTVEKL
jgi:large subunit ribosomal protein L30